MEDHSDHHKEDTDFCQQLSKKNPLCLVVRNYQQWTVVATYMSHASGTGDPLEMDWPHYPQASQQHCTTSLNLEPSGERKRGVAPRSGKKWKDWLNTGMPGGIMLAAYMPQVLIDLWSIDQGQLIGDMAVQTFAVLYDWYDAPTKVKKLMFLTLST